MQHFKRWITALVFAPLVVWVLAAGSPQLVAGLICVVAIATLREYLRIVFARQGTPVSLPVKAISYIMTIILVVGATLGDFQVMFLIFVLNFLVLACFALSRFITDPAIFDVIARQALGFVYIPVPLSLLVFLKGMEGGALWIVWMLIVIFANDTGAFYAGTYRGKHKLAPRISPKKTVEGAFGGIVASVVAGFVFCLIFFSDLALGLVMIPCTFLMAVAGQVGDLFESAMKRGSSIKDSGRILPGHGGMLDRIDGLLFAVPVLYVYLVFAI